jgi:phosphatidylglycerophosphatase A
METEQPDRAAIPWTSPSVILATGFWVGRIPWAPGTWGALLGVPLAWVIHRIASNGLQIGITAAICVAGVPICTAAARRMGGRKDPGSIVLDEIASMPIVFFFVPNAVMNRLVILAAGFVLHRIFDISKPPPARQLERLPTGLGIMADDWAAGAYACLVLHAVHWAGWFGTLWR